MATRVDRALELTAEAINAAGQISTRAAGTGFTGIAQRMAHVRDAIQELRGQIVSAGKSIGEARAPVARVPEQLSAAGNDQDSWPSRSASRWRPHRDRRNDRQSRGYSCLDRGGAA